MDAYDAIISRRSVREYIDKPISAELVDKIIAAGRYAPTANNRQPWDFIIIDDRTIMLKCSELLPYGKMLKEAPLAILVCGRVEEGIPDGYTVFDCAAATENILLAAHALGLGAVWLGVYPRDERMQGMREIFKIPKDIMPVALISIGYPAKTKPAKKILKDSGVYKNSWGKR
ncbi:MAG: nitroreductase family protein [Pseudomonadota bacterium]